MELHQIKKVIRKLAEENYKGLVQALVSIDTGINDIETLDSLYDTFMENNEASLFSMWLHLKSINGVVISEPSIYDSMEYILDEMQFKLGITIQDAGFTKDLYMAYDTMVHIYGISLEEIEEGLSLCIRRARGDISELSFTMVDILDNNPKLECIQQKLKQGKYSFI